MQLFLQIVLLIAAVSFAAAVYLGTVAFHEARPKFPLQFQDEPTARHAAWLNSTRHDGFPGGF